jgi:hypothetical protein
MIIWYMFITAHPSLDLPPLLLTTAQCHCYVLYRRLKFTNGCVCKLVGLLANFM